MPLNFPNSPTLDDIYISPVGDTWRWDGSSWVLELSPNANINTTPPVSPVDGTLWFNSETAQLFVYYDDGDSSQWVSVVPGVISSPWVNDGSAVYYDGSLNVGIGTSTPTAGTLTIFDQNPNIRFEDSDTANNGEITLDNTQLRIEVDEDNLVASSAIKFRVDGTDMYNMASDAQFRIIGDVPRVVLQDQTAPTTQHSIAGNNTLLQLSADFANAAVNSGIQLVVDTVEVARFNSLGLGIGRTPSATLDIEAANAAIVLRDTDAVNDGYAIINSGALGQLFIQADATNVEAGSYIAFLVDGTERMRVDGAGDLTVSGAIDHISAPKAWSYFDVGGAISLSYNVSSFTDAGVGEYVYNLTNSLVDSVCPSVGTVTNGGPIDRFLSTVGFPANMEANVWDVSSIAAEDENGTVISYGTFA